jgi:hypothetical protein
MTLGWRMGVSDSGSVWICSWDKMDGGIRWLIGCNYELCLSYEWNLRKSLQLGRRTSSQSVKRAE